MIVEIALLTAKAGLRDQVRAGLRAAQPVIARAAGYRGSVYSSLPHIPANINVKLDLPSLTGPGGAAFMYLWEPGAPH